MNLSAEKSSLRGKALAERDKLSQDERAQKSASICEELFRYCTRNLGRLQNKLITVYASMQSEVSLDVFVDAAYQEKARVCFPCMMENKPVARDNKAAFLEKNRSFMVFREVSAQQYRTDAIPFIVDPLYRCSSESSAVSKFSLVEPAAIDLVVVPLVAFDANNNRLGYGGGNYDHFLPQLCSDTLIVGVAFAEQRVEAVPTEPHDLMLPHIIFA